VVLHLPKRNFGRKTIPVPTHTTFLTLSNVYRRLTPQKNISPLPKSNEGPFDDNEAITVERDL